MKVQSGLQSLIYMYYFLSATNLLDVILTWSREYSSPFWGYVQKTLK